MHCLMSRLIEANYPFGTSSKTHQDRTWRTRLVITLFDNLLHSACCTAGDGDSCVLNVANVEIRPIHSQTSTTCLWTTNWDNSRDPWRSNRKLSNRFTIRSRRERNPDGVRSSGTPCGSYASDLSPRNVAFTIHWRT